MNEEPNQSKYDPLSDEACEKLAYNSKVYCPRSFIKGWKESRRRAREVYAPWVNDAHELEIEIKRLRERVKELESKLSRDGFWPEALRARADRWASFTDNELREMSMHEHTIAGEELERRRQGKTYERTHIPTNAKPIR